MLSYLGLAAFGGVVVASLGSAVTGSSGPALTAWKLELSGAIGWMVAATSAWIGLRALWTGRRGASAGNRPVVPRPDPWTLAGFQLVLAAVFALMLQDDPVLQEAFGLRHEWPVPVSVGAGLVAYAAVAVLFELGCRLAGVRETMRREDYRVLRRLWPRRRVALVPFVLAVCVLNPFTEEILYRAILVPHLSGTSGSLAAGAALGLACSVAAHLYQGWRLAPFHLLFHGTAIALFLSPAGLVGCIACHLAGDLWPVVEGASRMRRRLARLRARHDAPRCSLGIDRARP